MKNELEIKLDNKAQEVIGEVAKEHGGGSDIKVVKVTDIENIPNDVCGSLNIGDIVDYYGQNYTVSCASETWFTLSNINYDWLNFIAYEKNDLTNQWEFVPASSGQRDLLPLDIMDLPPEDSGTIETGFHYAYNWDGHPLYFSKSITDNNIQFSSVVDSDGTYYVATITRYDTGKDNKYFEYIIEEKFLDDNTN